MEIKCSFNPNKSSYYLTPVPREGHSSTAERKKCLILPLNGGKGEPKSSYRLPYVSSAWHSSEPARKECLVIPINWGKSEQNITTRPVARRIAAGLRVLGDLFAPIKKRFEIYKKNIAHTYEHKIIFSLIEKELFGKNTINSITHDADKLILYILGFPRSFVSEFHRKHSAHHIESKKTPNIRSMICDLIASSPVFKPEKQMSVRDYFSSSNDLKMIHGLREILEMKSFGENIDFKKIEYLKAKKYNGIRGFNRGFGRIMAILAACV